MTTKTDILHDLTRRIPALGLIGNTPLLEVNALEDRFPALSLKAKAEWMNPGGSIKDRAALAIVEDAEARGLLRPGGVIVHIGLGSGKGGLDVRRMTLQEITFIGTYAYTAQDFRDTARAIFEGHLGPLDWVDERPLAEGGRAFADIRGGVVAAPKVLLIP